MCLNGRSLVDLGREFHPLWDHTVGYHPNRIAPVDACHSIFVFIATFGLLVQP